MYIKPFYTYKDVNDKDVKALLSLSQPVIDIDKDPNGITNDSNVIYKLTTGYEFVVHFISPGNTIIEVGFKTYPDSILLNGLTFEWKWNRHYLNILTSHRRYNCTSLFRIISMNGNNFIEFLVIGKIMEENKNIDEEKIREENKAMLMNKEWNEVEKSKERFYTNHEARQKVLKSTISELEETINQNDTEIKRMQEESSKALDEISAALADL